MTKKLLCSLAFCLAAVQVLAAEQENGSKHEAEWTGYAGWIFMAPERSGLDFAMPVDDNRGKISHVDTEFDHGLRVGSRKRVFGGDWDAGFHYTWLCANDADEEVADSDGRLAGTRIAQGENNVRAGDIHAARSAYENKLHVLDLEWGRGWYPCEGATCFRMYGGLKYAAICEELQSEYWEEETVGFEEEGPENAYDCVWQRNRTQAYGTYLGFEGTYHIWKNVGLYGNASAGLLVGCTKRNFRQKGTDDIDDDDIDTEIDLRDTEHRMIANFNIDTGLVFGITDNFDVRIGWEYHCFVNNAGFIVLNQDGNSDRKHELDRHSDTLGYSGLYILVGVTY